MTRLLCGEAVLWCRPALTKAVGGLFCAFWTVFLTSSAVYAADEGDKAVLSSRGHQIYVNPKDADQDRDAWVTALWSMKPPEVAVSDSKVVSAGANAPPEAKPLVIGFQGKQLTGVLDTRTMATTRGKLATVVMKYIYSTPIQPWANGATGLEFSTGLGVNGYDQQGKAVSYVGATLVIRNKVSKKALWVQINFFDPRADSSSPGGARWMAKERDKVACSPSHSTQLPIVSSYTTRDSEFVGLKANSLSLQTRPFSAGPFGFRISGSNLRAFLDKLNAENVWCAAPGAYASDDLSQYELDQASVEIESYFGDRQAGTLSTDQYSKISFVLEQPSVNVTH